MSKQEFIDLLLNCDGFWCFAAGGVCELSCNVNKVERNEDDETILDASYAEREYESNMFRLYTKNIESVKKISPNEYDVVASGSLFQFVIPR